MPFKPAAGETSAQSSQKPSGVFGRTPPTSVLVPYNSKTAVLMYLLFGVSMEDGESKVIGVELPSAAQVAQEAQLIAAE